MISPQLALTKEAEDYLEDLAEELRVSDTRYEQAARSYKSLGEWLHRPASSVRNYGPQVYVQGSFRLGTTIKPLNEAEEYDVDSVCELTSLTKQQVSQAHLKGLLGAEIEAYRRSQNMVKPLREGRRCWVLDYADGAQFHMDVVPSLPNGLSQRMLLEAKGHDSRWAMTAIGITDGVELRNRVRRLAALKSKGLCRMVQEPHGCRIRKTAQDDRRKGSREGGGHPGLPCNDAAAVCNHDSKEAPRPNVRGSLGCASDLGDHHYVIGSRL